MNIIKNISCFKLLLLMEKNTLLTWDRPSPRPASISDALRLAILDDAAAIATASASTVPIMGCGVENEKDKRKWELPNDITTFPKGILIHSGSREIVVATKIPK